MSERTNVTEYLMEFDQSLFDYTYESVYDRVITTLGLNTFESVVWLIHRELVDEE